MSREIVQELTFFTHSVLMGLVITFVYDWIRVLRKLFRHGTALMSAEDLLFWLTCGIGVFYMLYRENDGTLRWFAVLGATVGMFFYKIIVRDAFVHVMSTCLHKIMWFIFRLLQIVLKPLKSLIFAGKTFVLCLGKKLKKCKEFIKKRLTAFIKTIRMVLCKHSYVFSRHRECRRVRADGELSQREFFMVVEHIVPDILAVVLRPCKVAAAVIRHETVLKMKSQVPVLQLV